MLPAVDIPVAKLRYFRDLARSRDAAELSDYRPEKRYALAVVFIRAQYNQTLDDAAELFIRLMQNLENVAKKNLMAYRAAVEAEMRFASFADAVTALLTNAEG